MHNKATYIIDTYAIKFLYLRMMEFYSYLRSPVDSILDAVLTVSPNRQYLGMAIPTTPATTEPECIP